MAIQVNIAEAKARLSELVRRAEAGEQVILARDGKPVAALTAAPAADAERAAGRFAHLGPLRDPYLLLRPDPETEAEMERDVQPKP